VGDRAHVRRHDRGVRRAAHGRSPRARAWPHEPGRACGDRHPPRRAGRYQAPGAGRRHDDGHARRCRAGRHVHSRGAHGHDRRDLAHALPRERQGLRRGLCAGVAAPRGRREPRLDADDRAGQGARLPHGRHRRAAAVRDPRALPGGRRAQDRDSVRAGQRVSARPVHGARADGPRLQVRPAGAAQGPGHRGRLHRHAGLPAPRRGHPEAPGRGRRERGVAEAYPGADRSGHRRQVGARDRAGGDGRDPGGSGRRERHTDEFATPEPGGACLRPPSVRAGRSRSIQ